MNHLLYKVLEERISKTCDNEFQDLVDEIFLYRYGDNYKPIRQKQDKGCDGKIESEKTILASYGPEKYTLEKFKSKVQSDFINYSSVWKNTHPYWWVMFNGEVTSSQELFVTALYGDSKVIGVKNIVKYIEELPCYQQKRIAKFLKIDDGIISTNILSDIIDDLIREDHEKEAAFVYDKPIYIEDKIKLNYGATEIEEAISEYDTVSDSFVVLGELIKGLEEKDKKILKLKIISDFNSATGSFKEKLQQTCRLYSSRFEFDDQYEFYIRVILIYIFEQCLIGNKTSVEQ